MRSREEVLNKRAMDYKNRTIVVKAQRRILVFSFLIVLLITLCIISSNTYADNKNSTNKNLVKQYKSVMIYSGDTLDTIAVKYMGEGYVSVNSFKNEVLSINGINEASHLIPGNHIIVPYYECIEDSTEVIFNLALN